MHPAMRKQLIPRRSRISTSINPSIPGPTLPVVPIRALATITNSSSNPRTTGSTSRTRPSTHRPSAAFFSTSVRSQKDLKGDPKQHHPDAFADGLTGNCLCGSITVHIKDSELFSRRRGHLCHCQNCRKVAGSYVASNLIIEEEKVEITDRDGTLKEFTDTDTLSGKPLGRFFCGECGNPIKSVTPAYAGKVVVKMGMFPRIPEPEFETFGDHRHPWQGHHPDMTKYKIKAREAVLEE